MQYLFYGVYLVHVHPRIHIHSIVHTLLSTQYSTVLLCYVLCAMYYIHDTRLICGYTDRTD